MNKTPIEILAVVAVSAVLIFITDYVNKWDIANYILAAGVFFLMWRQYLSSERANDNADSALTKAEKEDAKTIANSKLFSIINGESERLN